MPISILFVDDEGQILRALARSLRDEGYDLAFLSDPLAALELLESRPFDIVVSDFMMPGMTGVDFLATLRERRPSSLRMMMTGQADRQATIRAINEGAVCHYLEKPWIDAELKSVLRAAAHGIAVQRSASMAPPDLAGAARRFGRFSPRGTA